MRRILRLGSLESPSRSLRSKLKGERWTREEGFPLLHLGHSAMTDLKSQKEALSNVQFVKQTSREQRPVQIRCRGTEVSVMDSRDEPLLACSLLSVAQCVQETVHGFSDCIAVVFSSGAWAGECHVFQAKSPREAADISHSLQKHIKFSLRLAGRKRTDSTAGVSYTPTQLHRGFSDPQVQLSTRRASERLYFKDITMSESRSASPPPQPSSKHSELLPVSKLFKGPPLSPRTKKLFKSRSGKERELSKQERQELVAKSSASVEDSCTQLQAACRKPHPQSPFEKVLCAIGSSDMSQLRDLLDQKLLGVDSCDHDGNTLLHYAVSVGNTEAVRILGDRMASLNGPNISKLRPLHRAATTGNTLVLRVLLEMGANVNAQDDMSRTALHLIAGRSTHLECVWALLEHGASISTADSMGVRPYDLHPNMKEMQSRLIMSVCKSFAEPHPSSPRNASPYSSPSSSLQVYQQQYRPKEYEGRDIGELLQVVQGQARSLRSWALARKNKVKKTLSRSFSNLSELLEVEEDEMNHQDRLKRLQFPLAAEYTPEYFELEGGAVEVQGRLNSLIRQSKLAAKAVKRVSSEPELATLSTQEPEPHKQQSNTGSDVQAAMSEAFGALLQQFSDQPRPSVHREQRTSATSNLSEAFDSLQQDLQQDHQQRGDLGEKEIVRISPQTPHKFAKPKQDALSRPLPVQSRSKEETVAILDNIVAAIMNAAEESSEANKSDKSQPDLPNQSASVKTRRKSAVTRPEIKEPSSSSETKRRLSLTEGMSRHFPSMASSLDSGPLSVSSSLSSLHDTLTASQRGSSLGIASMPFDMDVSEAGSQSIRRLVLLSRNKECLNTLVSHMGLPRFSERLIALAQSPSSSDGLLHNIAILMQNIFENGGVEGRKVAMEAGVLDITIKLLSARDPIPGTCLVLLNSLLVGDDDNDHLRTIVRIPCEPLLEFLEPSESDVDSGFDVQRDTSLSVTTHSSSDDTAPRGLDAGPTGFLQPLGSKERASSFLSATSDSSSSRSVVSPTLQGHFVTHLEARRIVLKMLAVCSIHHKMKASLTEKRTLSLLTDYLNNPSQENVTNAVIALANVAQNINCHHYLLQIGIAGRLKPLLHDGPRPRYHALRLLVYLGKLKLKGLSLYQSTGYEVDYIYQSNGEHQYIRGATLEKAVELLTGDSRSLWGGITLPDTTAGHHPPREKIAEFFLTTFHSFMHPLLLMRLLLHRLDSSCTMEANPFNWMLDQDSFTAAHILSIPHHHQAVLNLIHMWMDTFPDDFKNTPKLQDYVSEVVQRMKRFKGAYTSHAHRLRSLLHDIQHPSPKRAESCVSPQAPERKRVPHHENLYTQCKQLVCEELLPVTIDQAVFLAALQLHIETLSDKYLRQSFSEGWKGKKQPKVFLTHLKQALPATYFRVKNVAKRVKEKMQEVERLSDRNAKHLYIQHCQNTPGYNCSFYTVKVPSGSKFRRSTQAQIMGISDSRLVLLDDRTRELTSSHLIQDVRRVGHSAADPCSLFIELQHTVIKVQVDKESTARQIEMLLDNYGQRVLESYEQADLDEWEMSWGQSPPSLHTSAEHDNTSSSAGSGEPGHGELLETLVPNYPANGAIPVLSNQDASYSPLPPDTNQEEPFKLLSIGDSSQHVGPADDLTSFCDCPPDPEFPLNTDVRLLSLTEILQHPMEVARQLTLLEHSKLCRISREELLQRIHFLPRATSEPPSASQSPKSLSSSSMVSVPEAGVEKLAYHFNQLANWVAHSVLQYHTPEDRAWIMAQFIEVAQHCRSYRNFSSMMAIIVAGLLSPSIRRLKKTWVHIPKLQTEQFKYMENLLSSKNNYKNYRDVLEKTAVPAVPFVAIFTRDLRFICDGNPDYLRNGLVNLHKRRQIFAKLEEIRHFQSEHYNFEPILSLQELLESYELVSDDELHALSHALEHDTGPRTTRPRSNSITSLPGLSVLRPPGGKAPPTHGSSNNLLST